MKERIVSKLREIEQIYNVGILLAVESGSRAWGFASPDSDYDVRFIYVRKKNDYLRLEEVRDVIELPISSELDINGWDLQKALRLLYKSNPTVFEWLSSPLIYLETEYAKDLRKLAPSYFSPQRSLYHYVHMAEGNYREYLRGETVKAKKYFYVLRPVLACNWILDKGTPPPMLFSDLAAAELPNALESTVDSLMDLKMNSPEIKEIARIDALNHYLDDRILQIKDQIAELPEYKTRGWEELDELFYSLLN